MFSTYPIAAWGDADVIASILVSGATFVLAFFTYRMSGATKDAAERTAEEARATVELAQAAKSQLAVSDRQVELARESFDAGIRPLLAEVPERGGAGHDAIVFPNPGRDGINAPPHALVINDNPNRQCSVPFRNIGAGVAVITDTWTEPPFDANVIRSRKFVPPGEHLRVHLSVLEFDRNRATLEKMWSQGHRVFVVAIRYTDAGGSQPLVTRAHIQTTATGGTFIGKLDVTREGEERPFVSSHP